MLSFFVSQAHKALIIALTDAVVEATVPASPQPVAHNKFVGHSASSLKSILKSGKSSALGI